MSQQLGDIQVQKNEEEIEIDLVELFYYFRSRFVVILVGFLTGALLVGLITFFLITPKYKATSKLYMVSASQDSIVDLTDLNLGTSLSSDYEELIKIRPIFEEIIEELGLDYSYGTLLGMTSVSVVTDTRILTITVESAIPEEAKDIANALANKAVTYLPKLMEVSAPNIAEHAVLPAGQSSPNLKVNVLVGALGGMLLVLAILTFFYMTDDTLKSAEDVEKAFGVMPLTVIPEADIESLSDKAEREALNRKKKKAKKKRKKKTKKNRQQQEERK